LYFCSFPTHFSRYHIVWTINRIGVKYGTSNTVTIIVKIICIFRSKNICDQSVPQTTVRSSRRRAFTVPARQGVALPVSTPALRSGYRGGVFPIPLAVWIDHAADSLHQPGHYSLGFLVKSSALLPHFGHFTAVLCPLTSSR